MLQVGMLTHNFAAYQAIQELKVSIWKALNLFVDILDAQKHARMNILQPNCNWSIPKIENWQLLTIPMVYTENY